MRFEYFVALRFCFSRKEALFISRISLIVLLTIIFSVVLPLVVLSVVNGFHAELSEKILASNFHVRLTHRYGYFGKYQEVLAFLNKDDRVAYAVPFFEHQGLIRAKDSRQLIAVTVKAFPNDFFRVPFFRKHFRVLSVREYPLVPPFTITGNGEDNGLFRVTKRDHIIIGDALSQWLQVYVGSDVELLLPNNSVYGVDSLRFQALKVSDLYSAGYAEYNKHLVFMHMDAPSAFYSFPSLPTGIGVNLRSAGEYLALKGHIERHYDDLRFAYFLDNSVFKDLFQEKVIMMFLMFFLVLCAFVTVSLSVNVMVLDKMKDIGVLRVIGVSSLSIQRVFFLWGGILSSVGVFVGNLFGFLIVFSLHESINFIERLVNQLFTVLFRYVESYFHIETLFGYHPSFAPFEIMSKKAFYMTSFPYEIQYSDVLLLSVGMVFVSLFACYFPVKKAAHKETLDLLHFKQ